MNTNSLGFIEGSRVSKIILQALKNANTSIDSVTVFDVSENALKKDPKT